MLKKKTKAALLLIPLLLSSFFYSPTSASPAQEQALSELIHYSLSQWHISSLRIDDAFSEKSFDLFLKRLDPNKRFFISPDIALLKTFKHRIDNQLKQQDTSFFELAIQLYQERIKKTEGFYPNLLNQPFDFMLHETIELDPKKTHYAATEEARKKKWRQFLKYRTLQNYFDAYKKKEGMPSKNTSTLLPIDPILESSARERVSKNLKRKLARMASTSRADTFGLYLDAISKSADPHSSYFPAEEKEDFDISMTGKLEGIGAVLREDDGYIKVLRVVPGSAAWRQKELEADDIILKVAQESGDPIDIVETPVREAVKLIRGKKGSIVTLTVKKSNNQIKDISIKRELITIEETFAKGAVLKSTSHQTKLGYIYLPSFYRDFKDHSNRSADKDIKHILQTLREAQVAGVILDLRNNGGGALKDAVGVTGQFIKTGPVVQVQTKLKKNLVLADEDPNIAFSKPLIVLVNAYSASASEIVAAALQDYHRAIIMGSKNSFGKGSVQTFINLDRYLSTQQSYLKPLGSLKLSIQRFFRINGESTQYKGVIPDIIVPSSTDPIDSGERSLDYALRSTTTQPLTYATQAPYLDIPYLKERSDIRVKKSPYFKEIEAFSRELEKNADLPSPISIEAAWERLQAIEERVASIESKSPSNNTIVITALPKQKAAADWIQALHKDGLLTEAINVMHDIVSPQ